MIPRLGLVLQPSENAGCGFQACGCQAWLWGDRAPGADPRSLPGSGLSGAAERVPAPHQLLGFAKHLVPVLQLFASGVHVGAHHHLAQLAAPCGGAGRENTVILWSPEAT